MFDYRDNGLQPSEENRMTGTPGELRNAVNSRQSELRRKTSDVVKSDRLEFGAEQSHDELDRHAVATQPPPRDRLEQALETARYSTPPPCARTGRG